MRAVVSNFTNLRPPFCSSKVLYERAAAVGSPEAEEALGRGWLNGDWGEGKDFAKAFVWLAKCAGREKEGCLLELGRAMVRRDSWLAEMGRSSSTKDKEVAAVEGYPVVARNGRKLVDVEGESGERSKSQGMSENVALSWLAEGVYVQKGRR